MGSISRFNLSKIAADYNCPHFVETGTWKGDAVAYALQTNFATIISVEIVPGIAAEAQKRFQQYKNVRIIEGNSVSVLFKELPLLQGNCIFWLDAHFPGAEEGINRYDAETNEDRRLPLEKEIEAARSSRQGFNDVLIIDDLRIYEDGPYENGNAPADTLPKANRNIDFIFSHFGATHHINRLYRDEGYILLTPIPYGSEDQSDPSKYLI